VVLTNTTFNTIRSFPYPSVDFNAIKECTDSKTVDFEYTGFTPDAASFYWEFGPDATPSYSTDINPQNVVFGDYGVKNVTLTVHRHGCTNSVSDSLFIDSPECGKNKVLVCHNGHTICISINALPAHLAQGDCIGECGMNLRNSIINSFETDETLLMNISPNPATNNTSISVFSSADKEVRIQILNTMGVLVETIYTGILESNSTKEISYSTDKLSAGIYFIYMEGENIRKVKKMTIIK
jgi:PKD repeat protein